jgi:hypothetical protein
MPRRSHSSPDRSHSSPDEDLTRRDKQEVASQSASADVHSDVHYGRKFAETEAILRARTEERAAADEAELEEAPLSPASPGALGAEAEPRRASRKPVAEAPATAEPVTETVFELVGAFTDQATRSLRGAGEAVRQVGTAGRELAGLPLEALRLVLRVGRAWIAGSPRRP